MLKGLGTFNPASPPALASADISGTPGSGTINQPSGLFAIAAGSNTATITNSFCTATSKVQAQVQTNDTTLKSVAVVPGVGSFVVTGNANATAITKVNFVIFN